MATDTHCHLFKEYYDDIGKVIENAKNNNITKMINNGTDIITNKEVLELSNKYPNIYPALGIHPEFIESYKKEDIDFIENNIDKIVAIGEIGLDYHYDDTNKAAQKELLETQLKLAEKYNKPVIIHSRDATEDTINILKQYPNVTGSIHCFTGSYETAQIYIKMGYKLGFGGVSTFKNAKIKDVIQKIEVDHILLETDSPYLSPEPIRGTKNEPANIEYILDFISKIKNIPKKELELNIEQNVRTVFDI